MTNTKQINMKINNKLIKIILIKIFKINIK